VFHQNKKEYDKAVESYRTAAAIPDFVLAEHAAFGLAECLVAQKKTAAAAEILEALNRKVQSRLAGTDAPTVQLLAQRLAVQLRNTGQAETGTGVRED
jgi:hypothetical protein